MSRRRYKCGENPLYDRVFDARKMKSPILNPAGFHVADIALQMSDKAGLKSLLTELEGNEEGKFWSHSPSPARWLNSRIKNAELAIAGIEDRFQNVRQQAVNAGHRPPSKMPKDMTEELLRSEARLDVVLEETEKIRKLLSEIERREQKQDDKKVLQRGPMGAGRLVDGICVWLDGQCVEPDHENVLRIIDDRSPYNGMRTADYFEFVQKPWCKLRDKMQTEERKRGEDDPGYSPRRNARPPLPPWPVNVPRPEAKEENGDAKPQTRKGGMVRSRAKGSKAKS